MTILAAHHSICLSEQEREHILAVANSAKFVQLPPSHIVPRLADHGFFIATESTF